MTKDEARQLIKSLRSNFAGRPQPDWSESGVMSTWIDTLTPYSLGDGLVALNDFIERCEAQFTAGKPIYFPAPIDFGAVVRVVALKHERQDYERHALDAAIRCDGSRWIDNEANAAGVRPFPALGVGVVPCPTCSPAQHAKSLGGDIHSRMETKGEQASPPPCRPHRSIEELPATAEQVAKHIAEARRVVAGMDPSSPMRQSLRESLGQGPREAAKRRFEPIGRKGNAVPDYERVYGDES